MNRISTGPLKDPNLIRADLRTLTRSVRSRFLFALSILIVLSPKFCRAGDTLTILDGAIQKAEDAPAVSNSYEFLSGDSLYLSFRVAGFHIRTQTEGNSETSSISLSYEATPLDARRVAVCPPITGEINTELHAEDKDWTPNRQLSFVLPSFVPAGSYRVSLKVRDQFANQETSRDFEFRVGGTPIVATDNLTISNFAFFRQEKDREPLSVPAYSPGDTVLARFDMLGFKLGDKNKYHLSYGLSVFRPDGKSFLHEAKAAELEDSSFYPVQYLPAVIQVSVPSSAVKGQYVLVIAIHDFVGDRSSETRRAFTIE